MPWPLSQDYNEAVQSPGYCFADPDLRGAEAATNALGLPLPRSGNFADVYQLRGPAAGRSWAVKCFTRQVAGLRDRYRAISAHLAAARLRFTTEFQYLEQGIRVQGRWYPALKMDWVEGPLLNEYVRDRLDRPATLEALADLWVRLARRLRREGLAHGDLQHGNVLLVPDGDAGALALKLIDYDGLFVPALAGRPSGEVGHPNYQHPERLREQTYNAEVDRFPLLVVYTAVRALAAGGHALWERYDNGDNLLFRQQDFEAPGKSALFYDLLKLGDPLVRHLAATLIDATRKPLDQAPLLEELVPGGRTASAISAAPSAPPVEAERPVAAPVLSAAEVAPFLPERPRERRRRNNALPWVAAAAAGVGLLTVGAGVILLVAFFGAGGPRKRQALAAAPSRADKASPTIPTEKAPQARNPVGPAMPKEWAPRAKGPVGTDTGWGGLMIEDPDGDCRFTPGPGSLTIAVPAALHDLGGPLHKFNAPRVLREVDGDFVLTVSVEGDFKLGPQSTVPRGLPYVGAGVLVWSDSDHFIRLERATMLRLNRVIPHIAFLEQKGGSGGDARSAGMAEGHCYLRLERKGNQFLGASGDGTFWQVLEPKEAVWPSKLKVGLTAISSSSEPFSVKFEQFELKSKGP